MDKIRTFLGVLALLGIIEGDDTKGVIHALSVLYVVVIRNLMY